MRDKKMLVVFFIFGLYWGALNPTIFGIVTGIAGILFVMYVMEPTYALIDFYLLPKATLRVDGRTAVFRFVTVQQGPASICHSLVRWKDYPNHFALVYAPRGVQISVGVDIDSPPQLPPTLEATLTLRDVGRWEFLMNRENMRSPEGDPRPWTGVRYFGLIQEADEESQTYWGGFAVIVIKDRIPRRPRRDLKAQWQRLTAFLPQPRATS